MEKCEICGKKTQTLYSAPAGAMVCYVDLGLLKWAAMLVWEQTEEERVTTWQTTHKG